jgi:Raf kinase inhibitor-like YbhB/YbcL family protein
VLLRPLRGCVVALAIALATGACSSGRSESSSSSSGSTTTAAARLALSSSAFPDQGVIPRQYSCDGASQSPPLAWRGVPDGTAELVLTVEDPDAPNGTFVHWLLYGVDPGLSSLGQGPVTVGVNGTNSAGRRGYSGPCPPKGTQHRYVFTLAALKAKSGLPDGASAAQVHQAVNTLATAEGRLVGLYGR